MAKVKFIQVCLHSNLESIKFVLEHNFEVDTETLKRLENFQQLRAL